MTFWDKKDYKLVGFEKSNRKHKMYNAVLLSKMGHITVSHLEIKGLKILEIKLD